MGILGPSGAGKSSVFKMVTMAINRTKGEIEMMGHDFNNEQTYQRLTEGNIGIVYQDDVIWPDLTVDQNLRFIGRLKGLTGS